MRKAGRPPDLSGPVAYAVRAVGRALLSFLFPDTCVACGVSLEASQRHLCPACGLEMRQGPNAESCVWPPSLELPGFRDAARPACARAFYALEFDGATRAMIHALKYRGMTSIALDLARAAAPAALRACHDLPDVVTFVPMHAVRLRERGFNQSELLAAHLAETADAPAGTTLVRTRNGPPQARMSRHERLSLPDDAFGVVGDVANHETILLVDDVVTTGATLAAASTALLRAGARTVVCFAVAGTAEKARCRGEASETS